MVWDQTCADLFKSIPGLSRLTDLESVVICLPIIAFRDFAALHAEQWAQSNPKLQRIGLLTDIGQDGHIKRARIWECRTVGVSLSESEWWSPATFRVQPEEWEMTICDLLYQVHPSRFLAELMDE